MDLLREIKTAVSGHGHGCACNDCLNTYHGQTRDGVDRTLLWRLAAAAVLLIVGLVVKGAAPIPALLLFIASVLAAGYDVFVRVIGDCSRGRFGEGLLMCIVIIGALAIGHGAEAAAAMLLLQIGRLLRGYTAERVRRSVMEVSDDAEHIALDDADNGAVSRAEEFISHFARIYTPIILVLSVLLAVLMPLVLHTTVKEGVFKALILMVIACPCAIVVSVPLAYFAGRGGASRQGILLGSSASMDRLSRVGAVVMDKESALEGTDLKVVSVKSDRMDAEVLLRIAAHACAYSDGYYARGIKEAYSGPIYIELLQSFQQDPGQGITVEVDGVKIILGVEEFIRAHGVDPGADAAAERSAYLAIDGQYAGRFVFGTAAKSGVSGAVAALSWEKDRSVAIVSSDTAAATEKFAHSVGAARYYEDCSPEEKAAAVRGIREQKDTKGAVLFVGDPEADKLCFDEADVTADLSGSGKTSSSADVVVLDGSLSGVVTAMECARQVRRIIRQNIIFVLAFKILVLVLDMIGVCPLWLAVLADTGAALAAVLNTMRALVVKDAVTQR